LDLNKREAKDFVDLFFEEIGASLEAGEQVKLSGFRSSECVGMIFAAGFRKTANPRA